jgi:hypothetical protein
MKERSFYMAKKSPLKSAHNLIDKNAITTMRVPFSTNKKFRLACEIVHVDAFTQVDEMLSKWADIQLKHLDQKTVDVLTRKRKVAN